MPHLGLLLNDSLDHVLQLVLKLRQVEQEDQKTVPVDDVFNDEAVLLVSSALMKKDPPDGRVSIS